jgi:hypothetical protein
MKIVKKFILILFFASVYFNSKAQNVTNSGLADFKAKCISVKNTYPTNQKIEQSTKITAKGKELFKKLNSIIERGSKLTDHSTIETFRKLADDLESVMKVLGAGSEDVKGEQPGTVAMKKSRNGFGPAGTGIFSNDGGGETACAEQCRQVYNNCMITNSCTRDVGICVCCMGCSLAYAVCLTTCVIQ